MDVNNNEKASNARKQSPLTLAIVAQIRAEMAAARLTTRALAKSSGVPERTLARLLNEERALDVAQFDMLCRALGVPMPTLLERANDRLRADQVGNGSNSSTG